MAKRKQQPEKTVSLDDFTAELYERVRDFREWYVEQNRDNPEAFPLEFDESNSGMWWEAFDTFK